MSRANGVIGAVRRFFGKFTVGGKKKSIVLRAAMNGRVAVPDVERYYVGVRFGGRLYRMDRKPRSFWDVLDFKRRMNCGRKQPMCFVLDEQGRIVSTIARKFMTVAATA